MNNYEVVFILNPVLSDDLVKNAVKKYLNFLRLKKSKIVAEEDWGLKEIAYPIQNKKSGFYHLLQFETSPETIKALEIEFKRDERIIRYLTVRLDKYALGWGREKKKENGL